MEDYAPLATDSPPRSLQEHDAPLGSSSASPSLSYPHSLQSHQIHRGEDRVGSEQKLSDLPSLSQQAALTILKDYDNGTIFAWLTGLRSFKEGGQNWFQPGCLSFQQLEAISALKDCTDSLVSAWLDAVRYNGSSNALHSNHVFNHFAAQKAAVTPTRNTRQRSSTTSRSSSRSFGYSTSPYTSGTSLSTHRSSCSTGTFLDLSQEPSIDEHHVAIPVAAAHTHWCFVCENPRVFTTCDGWKRHMKEHETRYPCMPNGHERYTALGPQCVLCGMLNPDEGHYNSHKILPCSKKSPFARSYTRKPQLVHHLKTHGISDGTALAEEWRDTLKKKYFSCGFCIACFPSHIDQLNHIDNYHFKNHQHISGWESNNLIKGLLLQPGVQESWQDILTVHSQYFRSGFRWSSTATRSLQSRLEKSEETANDLASAAFNESTYEWTQTPQVDPMPVAGFSNQDMRIHENMPTMQPQVTPAEDLLNPKQSPIYNERIMYPPHQPQYSAWHSYPTEHLSPRVLNANPAAYQNNSSQELMMGDRAQSLREVQLEPLSSSSNYWTRPQPPSHAPWDVSTTTPSHVYGGQITISNIPAAGGTSQTSSPPKPHAGHPGHPRNNNVSRTRINAATQPTSSSSNDPASPLTQGITSPRLTGPSSLPARPTELPSRTKLKDHYDINTEADMDIDFDGLQYFMREEEHTRSERRNR